MKTVASHRENIKKKLNLNTGEELARFAINWLRYRGADDSLATPKQVSQQPKTARSKRKTR